MFCWWLVAEDTCSRDGGVGNVMLNCIRFMDVVVEYGTDSDYVLTRVLSWYGPYAGCKSELIVVPSGVFWVVRSTVG